MARRWTPQRFTVHRRIRVAACAAAVVVASVLSFGVGARKSVALEVNGETTVVTTYAMSVDRLLAERGVQVKTHDLVQSTSGTDALVDHDVVTVRSAFQTTIVIDGREVPFWTVATSADQLLGFFASNEADAAKVTVDIKNVYNQLTGGFVINADGPVTVIADGKSSVAPDGRLPAASILDSKGITLGKEDRVSVERDGDATVLRVRRVTHGTVTKTVAIPHGTQTVTDASLAPGETVVRRQGEDGEKTETYDTTFVDGQPETETLTSSAVAKPAVATVIAVGPAPVETPSDTADAGNGTGSDSAADSGAQSTSAPDPSPSSSAPNDAPSADASADASSSAAPDAKPSTPASPEPQPSSPAPSSPSKPTTSGGSNNSNNSNNSNSGNSSSDTPPAGASWRELEAWHEAHDAISASEARLWHPTVAQAKAYARGAAAQRGWTGAEWDALEILWTKESEWQWDADNASSTAYGIPQMLPGWEMGYGWLDDGAVQIDSGLTYIAGRYGSPTKAWAYWQVKKWY